MQEEPIFIATGTGTSIAIHTISKFEETEGGLWVTVVEGDSTITYPIEEGRKEAVLAVLKKFSV